MAAKKTKRCPACKSDIPAESLVCPNCPYSFDEFQGEHVKPRKFGMAAWPPAMWALVIAVLMLGAFKAINFVITQADPETKGGAMENFVNRQRIVVEDKNGVEKVISDGTPQGEQRAKQVSGAPAAPSPSPAAAAAGMKAAVAALPDPPEDDEVMIGPGGPAPVEVKEWRLRGMVYNLVNLQPVPNCTMYFTDPKTHARYETSTDGSGAYKTIVPSLHEDGYLVTFQKEGFAKSYLNPGTENVPQMAEEDRRTTAAELAKTFDPPYQVQATGGAPLKTDFYLAPAN